jgi:hypothetical protein
MFAGVDDGEELLSLRQKSLQKKLAKHGAEDAEALAKQVIAQRDALLLSDADGSAEAAAAAAAGGAAASTGGGGGGGGFSLNHESIQRAMGATASASELAAAVAEPKSVVPQQPKSVAASGAEDELISAVQEVGLSGARRDVVREQNAFGGRHFFPSRRDKPRFTKTGSGQSYRKLQRNIDEKAFLHHLSAGAQLWSGCGLDRPG